jgi:elongation factor Ts
MAEITAQLVKTLREKTNVGMMECKSALAEANGDLEAAETILRKKGIAKAEKKADRQAKEGIIASYIHLGGRVGVLIEVNCETDFVAKNENFQDFVKDITLHIAAANPKYLGRDEVPEALIAKEREIAAEQVKGKPANIVDKIVDGKLEKIYTDLCLLEQAFIKDDKKSINDIVKGKIAELGENIVIRRFVRYAVGEDI